MSSSALPSVVMILPKYVKRLTYCRLSLPSFTGLGLFMLSAITSVFLGVYSEANLGSKSGEPICLFLYVLMCLGN